MNRERGPLQSRDRSDSGVEVGDPAEPSSRYFNFGANP